MWRSTPDWPYEVSNLGRVRRVEGGVLSGGANWQGYQHVTLSDCGRQKTAVVHRLVAEAFHGPCPEGHECNHKNGVKDDNRVENLEWVTRSENQLHAYRIGLNEPNSGCWSSEDVRGESHHKAKVTEDDVREIRDRYAGGGISQDTLAQEYGVTQAVVSKMIRRDTWSHVE